MLFLQVPSAAANQAPEINMTVPDDMTIFITGVVAALAFLLIAILISSLIKFEPGVNRRDPVKRRIWFWVLGVLAFVTTFVILFFFFMPATAQDLTGVLRTPAERAAYEVKFMHYTKMYPIATGVSFVLYVLLGFVLSKIFRTKKIADWFPSKVKN